jgi:putative hydrolase of the HAD superfamily
MRVLYVEVEACARERAARNERAAGRVSKVLRQQRVVGLIVECPAVLRAVLWDLGGVILTSPFEAFARYERAAGLPTGFLRSVNATDPHDNAWARLERGEITADEFDGAFARESAALGHHVSGRDVLALLMGAVRPEMIAAVDAVNAAGLRSACLTNNAAGAARRPDLDAVMTRFDVVVESSKVGVRKPEPRFYELACELLGVAAAECVFLDDLGVNLKPARALGMATIKVVDPAAALAELSALVGIAL